MNSTLIPRVLGAGILLLSAAGLAMYGQPDLEAKWTFLAPEYESRLTHREVFIDPAELLHLMNDDYIELIIYDVRDERDWNIFHLVDAERILLEALPTQRKRLRALSELGVVVIVSNDEILATEAWKQLMALAKPNAYILEGGLNHWLNIYGVHEDESETHDVAADLSLPDGTLRHPFRLALGARHAAARPDEHIAPQREYTPQVKLLKKVAKAGGCDCVRTIREAHPTVLCQVQVCGAPCSVGSHFTWQSLHFFFSGPAGSPCSVVYSWQPIQRA